MLNVSYASSSSFSSSQVFYDDALGIILLKRRTYRAVDAIQLIKARAASGELSSSLIEQSPISPTSPISAVSSTTSLPLSLRTGLNRTITTTSSTTHLSAPEQVDKKKGVDWGKVIALGGKGAKIIETSRQVLAGEREIQLSMNGNDAINKVSQAKEANLHM